MSWVYSNSVVVAVKHIYQRSLTKVAPAYAKDYKYHCVTVYA